MACKVTISNQVHRKFEIYQVLCTQTIPGSEFRVIVTENYSKTSFEKNCFSAWASTLNMGLINKVDMVCLSPLGYGV